LEQAMGPFFDFLPLTELQGIGIRSLGNVFTNCAPVPTEITMSYKITESNRSLTGYQTPKTEDRGAGMCLLCVTNQSPF